MSVSMGLTDSLTLELFFVTMILYNGMPIAGWIISVIAMKFYPLTGKKMIEIEDQIAKLQLKQTKVMALCYAPVSSPSAKPPKKGMWIYGS